MPGLVPGIPIRIAPRFSHWDGRDKPGHDVMGAILPILWTGPARAEGKGIHGSELRPLSPPHKGGGEPAPRCLCKEQQIPADPC